MLLENLDISLLFMTFLFGSVLTQSNGSEPDYPPNITYFSKSKEVALIGGSIELRCIFSGKPTPEITWSRPRNDLPSGRSRITHHNTLLRISNIRESDEGDYVCTTNNVTNETASYTHNIRVEAEPIFRQPWSDRPNNISVTEGDSVTFNCSAYAKPEATVVWYYYGQAIDVKNPPERFVFGSDLKSLTIRDVCRDCDDRVKQTDTTVIQCTASNVHGYAIASGYLNVLRSTRVTIRGTRNVFVDFLEAKEFVFQCYATSDRHTPATVRWYKTEPYEDLVHDVSPYLCVNNGTLIITITPNCSAQCVNFLGEYRCVGDNGYSRDNQTIRLSFQYRPPKEEENETCTKWIILQPIIGIVLFLFGLFLGFCWKRLFAPKRRTKDRQLPNPPSMSEQIGYDTIDQVLEEIRDREGAVPRPPKFRRCISHESIDAPKLETINRDRAILGEDAGYDDMGYTIPLEEAMMKRGNIDKNEVHLYESVRRYPEPFPKSYEQPEAMSTYLELSRKDVSSYLDMGAVEDNQYLDLCTEKCNPYLDMTLEEANPYLDMSKKEMDPNLYVTPDPLASSAQREADYLVLKN